MRHKRFSVSPRLIFLVVLAGMLLLVYINFHNISDYVKLYGYAPPAGVEKLADETAMTDRGRTLFYVNHPRIADRSSFNQYCSSHGENSIVLGCYHSVDRGIYLFMIAEPRLYGVEQVTAAHEMLHAAYDRLNRSERARIDRLLQDFYTNSVTDQRIKDTIAAYQISEPNDVPNEMHSIFATEIGTLSPELEDYYSQYFTNRKQVVDYASRYQQEFTGRRDQVKAYDAQLADLKTQMDANKQELDSQEADINARQAAMNANRSAGRIDEYNDQVAPYNARIERYNALVTQTQALIDKYNDLVVERNAIALEVKSLAESINSRIEPLD